MSKRTSFVGFLTVAVLISFFVFACSKKDDAAEPAEPADSNTTAESESPASQEVPAAEGVTEPNEADSNKPELTQGGADSEAPAGLIMAIAYSDRPSVLIGKELLYEGDTIRGVKVVKINEGTVEFEKNGERWTQEAGETLKSY